MKHRDRATEPDDPLRSRLVDLIDMRLVSLKLSELRDWEWFEREWAVFFLPREGQAATHPRLVLGMILPAACIPPGG
ncbi:hypothetical protein [Tropicibacter sp. S64]|uniref:hypothetical protein n=1 Tax=Tropicibacter sp. S64 TaxID=3415122 RepID=UPI003C7E93E8